MFTTEERTAIVTSQLVSLLWSSTDTAEGAEHENFDGYYEHWDVTAELDNKLVAELENWEPTAEQTEAIAVYQKHFDTEWAGQFGHDLALTRNHHGAGFWDRGLGDAGDVLTDWAESLGELNVFHGHDSIHPEWKGKFHAE